MALWGLHRLRHKYSQLTWHAGNTASLPHQAPVVDIRAPREVVL